MIKFKNILQENLIKIPKVWYHGSNESFNQFKLPTEQKFALLGKGIYFYQNKQSAYKHGNAIYKISLPKHFNIATDEFRLGDIDLQEISDKFNIQNFNYISGSRIPLWWATDGYEKFQISRIDVVNYIVKCMRVRYGFHGITAYFPSGGLVLCLWDNIEHLNPELIDIK